MPNDESTDEIEALWCIRDRWLFDADDEPSVGPDGPGENDTVLVDRFHPRYVSLDNQDHPSLIALLDTCSRGCPCTRRTITSV